MRRIACLSLVFLAAVALAATVSSRAYAADSTAASVDTDGHASSQPVAAVAPQPDGKTSTDGVAAQPRAGASGTEIMPDATPGERAYNETRDLSFLDPRSWAVMAYKSRHQLIVYYKGHLFKTFQAVFGRSEESGTKLWAGDRRTPEGLYVINKKYPSRRWHWFLRLNYPNRVDRDRYEQLREEGVVPVAEGRTLPEGSSIGIHGTDQPILNHSNINWTTGCISVDNEAVADLYRLLPIGTIVVIKP